MDSQELLMADALIEQAANVTGETEAEEAHQEMEEGAVRKDYQLGDEKEAGGSKADGKHENQMIVHGDTGGEADEGEEEYDFEQEEPMVDAGLRWFAVARYYSSRVPKTKVLFEELSKVWGEVIARVIHANRYLLEFPSKNALNFVLKGGPWTFKGDAVIVVRYEGGERLSDMVIESIALWVRIYDIPVGMMTPKFITTLASKVGRVLEVGEAARDFNRVRVEFALTDALKPKVQIKVKGKGMMDFVVKYENVPFFCFGCGRIGHTERECPDEELHGGEASFGKGLRASPFKRESFRTLSYHAPPPTVRKGLNFSGAQKDKVLSFSGSSSLSAGRQERPHGFAPRAQDTSNRAVSPMDEDGLATGVKNLVVDRVSPSPSNAQDVGGQGGKMAMRERVSGIDSFDGSSDDSMSTLGATPASKPSAAPMSMHDRLMLAKAKASGEQERRLQVKSPGTPKEKMRKTKGTVNPEAIARSLAEVRGSMGQQIGRGVQQGASSHSTDGEIRVSSLATTHNLVGTQDESHQEK